MTKVIRSLDCMYIPSVGKVLNYNDELEVEDKLAKKLAEKNLVDILDEKPKTTRKRTTRKTAAKKDEVTEKENE